MAVTTQITNIADKLDLTAYAGDFIDDYDMDAVYGDYIAAIDRELPDGITLCANGDVIAEVEVADQAREIDWDAITDGIDVVPIFQEHDVTARIHKVPSGLGGTTYEGRDRDGALIVAFGPDEQDGDGNLVEASDDSWSATQWIDGDPRQTLNGPRAEIEKIARGWMKTGR